MYTGSDRAGDKAARKSTRGVVMMRAVHVASFAGQVQKLVALSSEEAGLNAHVLGVCGGLEIATLCEEWGMSGRTESLCDSAAVRSIASRAGFRKRTHTHLQLKELWNATQASWTHGCYFGGCLGSSHVQKPPLETTCLA